MRQRGVGVALLLAGGGVEGGGAQQGVAEGDPARGSGGHQARLLGRAQGAGAQRDPLQGGQELVEVDPAHGRGDHQRRARLFGRAAI